MEGPRIITTASELAALAGAVDPAAPVVLAEAEIEPGADPNVDELRVVVAEHTLLPANAAGAIAAPGEPVAIVTELSSEGVTRRVAGVRVLKLRARWTLEPGRLGPDAIPADAAVRRADAFERPDGDMTYYLMEVQAGVDALRRDLEDAIGAGHRPLGPAAARRLEQAIDALASARLEIADAVRYGDVCDLARLGFVDDDRPCDPRRSSDVWVYLPDPGVRGTGSEELGCRWHAAVAARTIASSRLRSLPDTAS
ncbi:hypothetical protein ABZ897_53775 [Nonomuraea sp. NPDC046802]|uniref:hypothetical protein n=1 Tax=Nonomuraea sp. NPDC046802 TaxID=3154919 RepID=UPI0033E9D22C